MSPSPQLGIFAKTFSRPTLSESLDAVASHGLQSVQFNMSCVGLPTLPENIAPDVLAEIRRETNTRQISIAAVSGTFNLIHPNPLERRQGLRRLPVLAAACAQLGVRLITLCTGTRDPSDMWRAHLDNNSPEAWRDLRASLDEALAIAEEHDVTLAFEPETANVVNSAAKGRRLLDEAQSSRLKVVMDAANLFHPGDFPRMPRIMDEAFELLGADIALAHAKELDASLHPDTRGPGSGVLDWDLYAARLRAANFTGSWIMHSLDESRVTASADYLKKKLKTA